MAKKRAFVKYTKQGRLIPGSLIVTTKGGYPVDGLYAEVPTNICCDTDIPGTITTSPKGWVRYTKKGQIVPGSLIVDKSHPKNGVWKEVLIDLCCDTNSTTTTTTAPPVVDSMMTVNITGAESAFDIPWGAVSFGCWINMTNDVGFPRIFSIGQYPTASQAISIENDTLFFWYDGSPVITYSLSSYIGNWVWISMAGFFGNAYLFVNGTQVASGTAPNQVFMGTTLYIGSENAPNTYYDGLIAGFTFDSATDLSFPPSAPLTPTANTVLLLGQGNDLTQQTTDQGPLSFFFSISTSNITYSANSPYSPANGGSLQFGV